MKLSEYSSFDGLALAKLVRDKQVAPLDLTRLAIEAAAPLNARLNAIVEVYEDRAYGLRKDTDLMGPFAGVPLLLKDIGATEKGRPQHDETLCGGLNTEFVLTRTVRDATAVLDSVCGPAAGGPCPIPGPEIPFAVTGSEPTKRLRCALQTTSPITNIGSDVAIAAERVARELQTRGHAIEETSPQVNEVASLAAERTIWIESTGWEIQRLSGMTGNPIDIDHVEPLSLAAYRLSRHMTADDWFKAKAQCNAVRRAANQLDKLRCYVTRPAIANERLSINERSSMPMRFPLFLLSVGDGRQCVGLRRYSQT